MPDGRPATCTLIVAPAPLPRAGGARRAARGCGASPCSSTRCAPRPTGASAISRTCATSCAAAPLHGAAFVGLNPLHALFPANPGHFSPYSPSTRHFLNVLYIAVPAVAGVRATAPRPRRAGERPAFARELAAAARDGQRRLPGRRRVPSCRCCASLYEHFRPRAARARHRRARGRSARYRDERGEPLRLHALHDAIDGHLRAAGRRIATGAGRSGPTELRDPAQPRRAATSRQRTATRSSSMRGCSGSRTSSSAAVQRLARRTRHADRPVWRLRRGREPRRLGDLVRPARLPHGRGRRRAARSARAQGPGLGHSAAGSARADRRALSAVPRPDRRQHAPLRRAAPRSRDGAVPPVVGAGRASARPRAATCTIRSTT